MTGLLIDGAIVPVDGVTIIGPHDAAWSHLSPGDCRPRQGRPHQVIVHRTIGDDPDHVLLGKGPSNNDAGGAARTAQFWLDDPAHSAAHIVIGLDGTVACLADLVRVEAYHATVSNAYSIGIELHEQPGGVLYQAQLDALVAVVKAICEHVGIQLQVPNGYTGHPLKRMLDGGRDCIGVFGHRDNTEQRGHWDPGDAAMQALIDAGAHPFDFDKMADVAWWMAVQQDLAARKLYSGAIDGVPGPATTAALRADGYRGGVYALGKA